MIQLSPGATLYHGDCRETFRKLPSDSLDSCVTDPPYELNFMGKGWDNTGIANDPALWAEVFRVLKPGGHLAAFSASRTYHRMACAIEDAGFEIRDSLMWMYGTGFPKSQNVGKMIDKRGGAVADFQAFRDDVILSMENRGVKRVQLQDALGNQMLSHYLTKGSQPAVPNVRDYQTIRDVCDLGDKWDMLFLSEAEREITRHATAEARAGDAISFDQRSSTERERRDTPATPAALEWEGWGTALKPAFEPIVLARKPLSESTVAANILKWRTGALNINGCRVRFEDGDTTASAASAGTGKGRGTYEGPALHSTVGGIVAPPHALGRWPANVVHDGSDEVVGAFPSSKAGGSVSNRASPKTSGIYGAFQGETERFSGYADNGSAARFFYSAKASKQDRNGSKHPTVKPIALMEWLATLITPPGGTILDPFAGSGTTGIAATRRGFQVILCEREAEYVADIRARFGTPRRLPPFPLDALRAELALAPALAALRARLCAAA